MIILAGFVITIVTVIYIAWPWLSKYLVGDEMAFEGGPSGGAGRFTENDQLAEFYLQLDANTATLEELEFDLKSGTLSSEAFNDLKESYEAEAKSILKQIDEKVKCSSEDSELEKQILGLRQGVASFCPECGGKCREDDKFCVQCGTKL